MTVSLFRLSCWLLCSVFGAASAQTSDSPPAAAPTAAPVGALQAPAAAAPAALSTAAPVPPAATTASSDWRTQLQGSVTPLEAPPKLRGDAQLKGKRFFVSEYRVMFEVGGSVTGSTRASYFGGTNRGATRSTVEYQMPGIDLAVLQAITDRAYADFLTRMDAAGARPEPAEAVIREFGVVYEAAVEPSRPGTPVFEDVDLGHGKRRYIVMAPTGTKLNSRGFAGLGAGNMSTRMVYVKANVEAISVALAVNLAAQESSGTGSSLFKRGSSANASAAMEVTAAGRAAALQSHGNTYGIQITEALPVPGQFATLRETGGFDSTKNAAVVGLNTLFALAGVAANNSKKVTMDVEVDAAAMAPLALKGLATMNQAIAASMK